MRARALRVTSLRLSADLSSFDEGRFKRKLCDVFEPPCSPGDVRDLSTASGSTVLNFTVQFVHGGPTVNHMRARLDDKTLLAEALAPEFELIRPFDMVTKELTNHRSNADLVLKLVGLKTLSAVNMIFGLVGAWCLVVFWSITARGQACRQRAHSEWSATFIPSGETLQVLVLSSFVQLIICLSLHSWSTGSYGLVYLYGAIAGTCGAMFVSLLNAWIRGESVSLRNALEVDQISTVGGGADWNDTPDAMREYGQVYTAGGDRTLGNLAAHDWEQYHKDMETRFGIMDISDQVFDEVVPEKDPGVLAAFLNSKLLGAFTGKKEQARKKKSEQAQVPPEMQVVSVDVPVGLPRTTLRDALLQWRLRHTAHPREALAVDWVLGQSEPAGFELLAVKVPEQARLLLYEAIIQWTQAHAELQLDASHAVRTRAVLEQLSKRAEGTAVSLPDDGVNTEKVRELVVAALRERLTGKSSKREITQEEVSDRSAAPGPTTVRTRRLLPVCHTNPSPRTADPWLARGSPRSQGMFLQQSLHSFEDAFSLISMPFPNGGQPSHFHTSGEPHGAPPVAPDAVRMSMRSSAAEKEAAESAAADNHLSSLKAEIERRADEVRAAHSEYLYDDELFCPVPIVVCTKPPDAVEIAPRTGPAARAKRRSLAPPPTAKPPSAAAPSASAAANGASKPAPAGVTFAQTASRAEVDALGGAVDHLAVDVAVDGAPPGSTVLTVIGEETTAPPSLPPSPPPSRSGSRKGDLEEAGGAHVVDDDEQEATDAGRLTSKAASRQGSSSSLASAADGRPPPRSLRAWWKKARKQGADHAHMPCWKQYFVLFVGSVVVSVCTITVITMFSIISPVTQYFVLFSFSGALPYSFLLHWLVRTFVRYLRKRRALARGRKVEGAFSARIAQEGFFANLRRGSKDLFQRRGSAQPSTLPLTGAEAAPDANGRLRTAALGLSLLSRASRASAGPSTTGQQRLSKMGPQADALERTSVSEPRALAREMSAFVVNTGVMETKAKSLADHEMERTSGRQLESAGAAPVAAANAVVPVANPQLVAPPRVEAREKGKVDEKTAAARLGARRLDTTRNSARTSRASAVGPQAAPVPADPQAKQVV